MPSATFSVETGVARKAKSTGTSFPWASLGTKDWVLDFTQAKVENINGKVEVTIPKSAVNLDSGGIYYFEIHDVTDTSLKQNKIEPNPAVEVFTFS